MAKETTREANVAFNLKNGDAFKQGVGQIREEIEGLGDAGKRSAQKVVDATEAIQRGYDRVEKKVTQGKVVTIRDVSEMAVNVRRLEAEYIRLYGSIENAPASIQASWGRASAQLRSVEGEVVRSTKAIEDQRNVTNQAGASWTGWGNAIDNVNPKLGTMVAKLGTVAAAFTAGWSAGQQLNKFFGTDMAEWDAVVGNFGARCNAIIRQLSDNIVGVMNLATAIFSRDMGAIKQAIAEIKENGRQTFAVLSDGGKAAADTALTLKERMTAQADAIKKAAEEAEKHREAIAKTAAGYAALGDAMGKTVEAIQKQSAEMKKNQAAMLDAEHVVINRKKDMEDYARGVDAASQSLKDQTSEVASLTQAHGANDPMTLQAINRQTQLATELETAKTQYDTAKTDVNDYAAKQTAASNAVNAASTAITKLTTDLGMQQLQLIGLVPLADQYASAVEKSATKGAAAATATTQLATATSSLVTPATSAGTAVDALATNTDRVAAAMGTLKTNADAAGASITALISKINTAITKMGELDAATDRAAGGDGGGGGDDGGGRS